MKAQFLIGALVLSMVLIMGCTGPPPIVGGDTDEHGCKASAGYSWDESIGACIRSWEIDEDLAKAAKIAVEPLSYPVTVIEVEVLRCPGCFDVKMQRNDNQEIFQVSLRNWEIVEEPLVCTMDAKICPDGSAVGRDSYNNCEFFPCPDAGMPNPASKFCQAQGGESKIITNDDGSQKGICILPYDIECDEWEYFRGECPASITCTAEQKAAEMCTMEYMPVCGDDGITYGNKCSACASKAIDTYTPGECPAKTYVSRDLEQCKVIKYMCIEGKAPFTDEYGCGCEPADSKLKANECTDPRPEVCTEEYMPVCGWFDSSIQCIKYPCAATYGNKCSACADPKVAYWTDGECPETIEGSEGNIEENPDETETSGSAPGSAELANPASAYCVERGGTLELRDDYENEGQIGLCILPNGLECEEWAYMRGECP